ncbi:MAG TPA: cutinase family protein, partial [Mycobacterium sp.]
MHALLVRRFVDIGLAAAMIAAALMLAASMLPPGTPGSAGSAAAVSCPQVQVVFARGRYESPGPGVLGNAFINALQSKVSKNIGVYAVRYPADTQVDVGANDMSHHVQDMVNNCPDARLVLGGYSLGAAVT